MNIQSRHVLQLCIITTLMVGATTSPLDDNTGAFVPDDPARVLLISSVVDDADVLAAAAAEDVLVIRYETESTDLDALLGLVRDALGGRKALSIGFAAHDFGEGKFYLTGSETVSLGSTLASASQRAFWQELGALIEEGGRIDLFACKLAYGREGLMLVSAIEAVSGVGVAASSDNTGNVASGGDWILETDDINLADLYFCSAELDCFSGLLTSHVAKLTASDAADGAYFGLSVSISGDYAVVGAYGDYGAYSYSGSAYIFYRNQGGADNWGQVAQLTASDAGEDDYFGCSVAISGDTVVVGADGDESSSGSAYVFVKPSSGWTDMTETVKLMASDGSHSDYLGHSVAVSGDTVVAGAYGVDSEADSGAAYVFVEPVGGWTSSVSPTNGGPTVIYETVKLKASDYAYFDFLGYSVAISGNIVVAGAYGDDSYAGSAYIFVEPGGGWASSVSAPVGPTVINETARLKASDAALSDYFGYSVAIYGSTIVVGAPKDDSGSGSVYVFEDVALPVSAPNTIPVFYGTLKLRASDFASDDEFGTSVSISGDYVVVGAPFEGYTPPIAFSSSDGNPRPALLLDGVGAAYLFVKPTGGWDSSVSPAVNGTTVINETAKITASDGTNGDRFGTSVSISGDHIIAGAPYDSFAIPPTYSSAGTDPGPALTDPEPGSAYVYMTTPQISNPTSTDVSFTAATLGATVDNEGLSAITERGVVWGTSANPTVTTNDGKETSAGTTGTFTVSATGLSSGTTYHFRGYATNSFGTAYTSDTTFTTSTGAPSISNPTSTNVTSNSATLGATVNNNGGSAITERGVVWSTSANPTVGSNEGMATSPGNVGTFTVPATSLSSNITYHFRGFATNAVGTAYTEDATFSTSQSNTGSLKVTIQTGASDLDGTYWRIGSNGGNAAAKPSRSRSAAMRGWHASGQTIELEPGSYTIEFLPVPGWIYPDVDVEVEPGKRTKLRAEFIPFLVTAASDYDGDGDSDPALFQPSGQTWHVQGQSEERFGRTGSWPVPGDYDGDGIADLAYWNPRKGIWRVKGGPKLKKFGFLCDLPVPADYDGDGLTDPALYRPSTGEWFIHLSSDAPARRPDISIQVFGGDPDDLPVPGDYDGDGLADPAVYNLRTRVWRFAGGEDLSYGRSGEIPVPADYDGDGITDVAMADMKAGLWRVREQFRIKIRSKAMDVPVPGDYNGDGSAEVAYFRTRNGRWYLEDGAVKFGSKEDIPLVRGH